MDWGPAAAFEMRSGNLQGKADSTSRHVITDTRASLHVDSTALDLKIIVTALLLGSSLGAAFTFQMVSCSSCACLDFYEHDARQWGLLEGHIVCCYSIDRKLGGS